MDGRRKLTQAEQDALLEAITKARWTCFYGPPEPSADTPHPVAPEQAAPSFIAAALAEGGMPISAGAPAQYRQCTGTAAGEPCPREIRVPKPGETLTCICGQRYEG